MSQRKRQRLVRRRRAVEARARISARSKFIATGGVLSVAATALAGAPAQAALAPVTTTLVADLSPGGKSSGISNVTAVGSSVFFTRSTADHGTELWRSDGTATGTALVKDIRPGGAGSGPSNLTAVGGTLFFTANDRTTGRELWKSDGTSAGTVLVKDIDPRSYSYYGETYGYDSTPQRLTAVGNTLFFTARDGAHGGSCGSPTARPPERC